MRLSFDQSLAKLCESALRRRIITEVTDLDDQAGDQVRVDRDLEDRVGSGQLRKPVASACNWFSSSGTAERTWIGIRRLRRSQAARASLTTTSSMSSRS